MPPIAPCSGLCCSPVLATSRLAQRHPVRISFPGFVQPQRTRLFPELRRFLSRHTPLSAPPSVISLDHLDPEQMSQADYEVVSNLSPELSKQAALANFDISSPAWHFQQIVCPAFPGLRLPRLHPRRGCQAAHRALGPCCRAIAPRCASSPPMPTVCCRLRPPGTGQALTRCSTACCARSVGDVPLSHAPNWLMIAVCYAELSGYPVQVLNTIPRPEPTLDMLRLDANRPQMMIEARSERRCHLQRRFPAHHHHQLDSSFRSARPDHVRFPKPGAPACAIALKP